MKLAVRAFALTLVAVGAYASTHTVRTKSAASPIKAQVISAAMPVPTCLPSSGCGVIKKGGIR